MMKKRKVHTNSTNHYVPLSSPNSSAHTAHEFTSYYENTNTILSVPNQEKESLFKIYFIGIISTMLILGAAIAILILTPPWKNSKTIPNTTIACPEKINDKDKYNRSVLLEKIIDNNSVAVKSILDCGANVNARITNAVTPLIWAAAMININPDVMTVLLDHGANINDKGSTGGTALLYASSSGTVDTVRFLLDHGANIDATDNTGATALHYAASNGDTDIVRLLLDRKASLNAKSHSGGTPLHYAAYNSNTDTVRLLLDRGANINATENYGLTPLDIAQSSDSQYKNSIIALLRSRGAKSGR